MRDFTKKAGVWLLAILCSVVAQAYDLNSGGVYYNLNTSAKTATVTTGDALYSGTVTIPATVTSGGNTYTVTAIANEAFKNCIHLTAVNIGSNVTTIGYDAFYGCEELEEIVIPDNVKTLGGYAGNSQTFVGCTALKTATLGSQIQNMGSNVFKNCQNLTTVTIHDGCTIVADATFYGCSKLSQIIIPNSVKSVGNDAFNKCTSLVKVIIGDGTTTIGNAAFQGCIRLNDLTFGENVRTIGYDAFASCTSLEEVVLTDNIVTFSGYAGTANTFANCTSLEAVTLGNKIANMGYGLFKNCTSLKYVTIKEGCSVIGGGCFVGCTKLANLSIPSTVTTIGDEAFKGCIALKQITVPNSVLSIGNGAFYGCTAMTKATIGDGVTSIGNEAFYGCNHMNIATLGSEVRTIGHHAFTNCTELEEMVLTNNVVKLGGYAGTSETFMNCTSLSSVTLGKKLVEMGTGAFLNCTSLRTVNILDGCSLIGDACFKGCNKIASVTIPNTVVRVGNEAFMNCGALLNINIPESVETIGDDAFKACTTLRTATIGDGATSIGAGAFNSCTKLTEVHIGNSVKSIGHHAFESCTELTTINLTDNITTFGTYAGTSETFKGCTSLDNIILGKRVTSMGTGVFLNCTGLITATIHDGCELIGETCFKGCTKLSEIIIPNSVLQIKPNAFQGCTALRTATIGDGVTSIGNEAFINCKNLTNLKLGEEVKTIGHHAFEGCSALKEVIIPDWVTTLATYAGNSATFLNCTALQRVTLGKRLNSVGTNVFQGCTNLESVTAKMPEPISVNANVFPLRQQEQLYVIDAEAKALYAAANVWKEFGNISVMGPESVDQTLSYTMPTKTYGDASFTLPATTNEGLTLTWSSGNSSVATISGNTLTVKNAGSATITASQAGNSSYNAFSRTFTLTVNKATLTVTANNATKKQGEDNPTLTVSYSGFKNGDTAASLTTQPTATTTATKSSPAGTYPITVSGGASNNYTFNYVSGTLTITDGGSVSGDYRMYPGEITVHIGETELMGIQLDNQNPVIMFEFYMQLPNGLYIAKDEYDDYDAVLNASRADRTHVLVVEQGSDGLYHFLCYSSRNKAFNGNNGELLTVNIGCQQGVQAGIYQGTIKNIILSDQDKQEISVPNYTFNIEVVDYILGDVNNDRRINGMDIVELVSLIMDGGYSRAGDLYPVGRPDGKLNGMDLVELVELVMSQSASVKEAAFAKAYAPMGDAVQANGDDDNMKVTDFTITPGATADVPVELINPDMQYIMTEFWMELPDGVSLATDSDDDFLYEMGSRFDNSHSLVISKENSGNVYHFLIYSTKNRPLKGNSGSLFTLTLQATSDAALGDYSGRIFGQIFSDLDKVEHNPAEVPFKVTIGNGTGVAKLTLGGENVDVYSTDGRLLKRNVPENNAQQSLSRGIYIINGKKVVVK